MAALTTGSVTRVTRADNRKIVEHWQIGTAAVLYEGALAIVNQSTGTYGRAIAGAVGAITNRRFLGVVEVGGTGDASGTVYARIAYGHQALINFNTTQANTLLGTNVCIKTDNDVAMPTNAGTTGNRTYVGVIAQWGQGDQIGDAWIWLRQPALTS